MVRIVVSNTQIYGSTDVPVTSGSVGVPVQFMFDSTWDGLQKMAVFEAGDVKKVVDISPQTTIPWEVLVEHNLALRVGVYGVNADGTTAIPTIWVNVCNITEGTTIDGEGTSFPTPPIWGQLIEEYLVQNPPEPGPVGPQGPAGATGPVGPKGPAGETGPVGPQGIQGEPGAHGLSAYQVAVNNGFQGTQAEWLQSLKGEQGPKGETGATGRQGERGSQGPKGEQGIQGERGPQGNTGAAFTYDMFTAEQLQQLIGPQGPQGIQGPQGPTGDTGPAGPKGDKPVRGTDYWTAEDRAQIIQDVLNALPAAEDGEY